MTRGSVTNDAIRLEYSIGANDNHLLLDFKYQSLSDNIPAQKVPKHLDDLEQARDAVWYELKQGSAGAGFTIASRNRSTGSPWIAISIIGLIVSPFVVVGGIKAARLSRRRRQFKGKFEIARGDAAAQAIPIATEADIVGRLPGFKCACGTGYRHPAASFERESLIFDGNRVIAIQLKCGSCDRVRDIYFAPQL